MMPEAVPGLVKCGVDEVVDMKEKHDPARTGRPDRGAAPRGLACRELLLGCVGMSVRGYWVDDHGLRGEGFLWLILFLPVAMYQLGRTVVRVAGTSWMLIRRGICRRARAVRTGTGTRSAAATL
jgi:hypothetical protein